MPGLSLLGVIHTAISLVAVASGAIALFHAGEISGKEGAGKTYVVTTILTCLTGFGIFHHGGFGKAHVLGIITLAVIVIALASESEIRLFGRLAPYVAVVGYSLTFFFHFIPAITETATRLPVSSPLASSPDDPHIQMAIGICFILFLIVSTLQVLRLRARARTVLSI